MPRRTKYISTKDVAKLLKVSPEVVTYLRQEENLPFVKNNKYILFSEPEVIRWRNRKLSGNSQTVLNLKKYYFNTKLFRFIEYEDFKVMASDIVFLDGDDVIQYIKRQNPEKDLVDLVGDIVFKFWDSKNPKCSVCGKTIISKLNVKLCSLCEEKQRRGDS